MRSSKCAYNFSVSRRRSDEGNPSPAKAMDFSEEDKVSMSSDEDVSKTEAMSTSSTSRNDERRFDGHEESDSEPSSSGSEHISDGSEMSGSLDLDEDSDDNF